MALIAYIAGWSAGTNRRSWPSASSRSTSRSGSRRTRHRHTPGAHELASSGVRMLACAGDTYFEFADGEVHDEQLAC
jgi:hypothetical protein